MGKENCIFNREMVLSEMTTTTTTTNHNEYSGCNIPPDQGLIDEGWALRGVPWRGTSRGIDDILELYEELGFEVRLEQRCPDLSEMCEGCSEMLSKLKVLYTRKKGESI